MPQTNGAFGVFLVAPNNAGGWEAYRYLPVDCASGQVTLSRDDSKAWGKRIPRDLYVKPNTRAFWFCPTGGGQISYTNTDGPNPVGENLIGAKLPPENMTISSPGLGTVTVASNSGTRLFAAEWTVDEFVEPHVSEVFFDEQFLGTGTPPTMQVTGAAWTFSAGVAEGGGTGRNAHMRAYFGHALDHRSLRFDVEFGSGTSIINVGSRPAQGNYGTIVKLDIAANTWSIGNMSGATADPVYFVTRTWPGTLAISTVYTVTITRDERGIYVGLRKRDGTTADSYSYDLNVAQIPPLTGSTGTESNTLDDIGMVNGMAFAYADSGTIKLRRVRDSSPDRDADELIVGDSIANASRNAYADGWAQRLRAKRAGNGKRTAIMAIDGWSPLDMRQMLARLLPYMPNLRRVLVAGGTNRMSGSDDTRDSNMFTAQSGAIQWLCDCWGMDAYWGVPAPFNATLNYPGPTQYASYLATLGTLTRMGKVRFDKALTTTGTTIDTTLYYGSGGDPHPNAAGHTAMLARVYTDAPELL